MNDSPDVSLDPNPQPSAGGLRNSTRNPFGYRPRKLPARKTVRRKVICTRTPPAGTIILPAQPAKNVSTSQVPIPVPDANAAIGKVISILHPPHEDDDAAPCPAPIEPPSRARSLPSHMKMATWGIPVPATRSAHLEKYLLNKEPFSSQWSDHNLFYKLLPERLIERPASVADKLVMSGGGFTGLALAAAVLRIPLDAAQKMGELKVRQMLVRKRRLWGPLQMDAILRGTISKEVTGGPEGWNGSVSIFLLRGYRDQVHIATCTQHNSGLWMRHIYPFTSAYEWHNANLFDIHDARLI